MVFLDSKKFIDVMEKHNRNVFKKTGNKLVEVRIQMNLRGLNTLAQYKQDDVEALVFGLKWSQKYLLWRV